MAALRRICQRIIVSSGRAEKRTVGRALQHGFGEQAGDFNDGKRYALAANYQIDRLFLALTFANVDQAHNEAVLQKATEDADGNKIPEIKGTNADGRAYQVGASADFNAVTGVTGEERAGGWKGLSAVLGADYVVGKHKFMADVEYFDGEMELRSDLDFKRTVAAAAYEYYFAKNVIGYTALTYSWASGSAAKQSTSAAAQDTMQFFLGLNYNF
ncbi:MAG: hypothetical protein J6K46_03340 [Sutterella sp.]|nr:hypothetical protein [Sutterella sp.]